MDAGTLRLTTGTVDPIDGVETPWSSDLNGKYHVILADPPWSYGSNTGKSGLAKSHYKTMSFKDISAIPVWRLASDDCILFLWSTFPLISDTIAVMQSWGFTYKTCGFTWIKTNKDGSTFIGLGNYSRGNAEVCLIGTKGKMASRIKNRDVSQVIISRRRKHSQKPEDTYHRIERMFDGPYIELFARSRWNGWDSWGNELDGPVTPDDDDHPDAMDETELEDGHVDDTTLVDIIKPLRLIDKPVIDSKEHMKHRSGSILDLIEGAESKKTSSVIQVLTIPPQLKAVRIVDLSITQTGMINTSPIVDEIVDEIVEDASDVEPPLPAPNGEEELEESRDMQASDIISDELIQGPQGKIKPSRSAFLRELQKGKIVAPFSYVGSKKRITHEVWKRLGIDTAGYIEPFFGSGAVMFARSNWGQGCREVINDADGLVVNFWRAVQNDFEGVIKESFHVWSELDLTSRSNKLVIGRGEIEEKLRVDPSYYDMKLAAWWVFGRVSSPIFARNNARERMKPYPSYHHNRQAIKLSIQRLHMRLANVHILCGDFMRALTPVFLAKKPTAVFLDPPYASAECNAEYAHNVEATPVRTRKWCLENGSNLKLRIALCGFSDEHEMPADWEIFNWVGHGGFGLQNPNNMNRFKERIWFSPGCIRG